MFRATSRRSSGSCSDYPQFMQTLKFRITSRREFERLAAANADTLSDLQRAGRFLYLQRLAFGGKIAGRNFGVDSGGPSRFDVTKLGPLLDEIHERLAGDCGDSLHGRRRQMVRCRGDHSYRTGTGRRCAAA
jgi:hypothetical protein